MYNTYITFARKYKLFAIRILHSIKHTLQAGGTPEPYNSLLAYFSLSMLSLNVINSRRCAPLRSRARPERKTAKRMTMGTCYAGLPGHAD